VCLRCAVSVNVSVLLGESWGMRPMSNGSFHPSNFVQVFETVGATVTSPLGGCIPNSPPCAVVHQLSVIQVGPGSTCVQPLILRTCASQHLRNDGHRTQVCVACSYANESMNQANNTMHRGISIGQVNRKNFFASIVPHCFVWRLLECEAC
jgi:hypothetical protein